MRKLWKDIQAHKGAAVLYLVYWLATLAVVPFTWNQGIPTPVVVLLLANSLIAGALVGWWRTTTPEPAIHTGAVVRGGMLAGALSAVIAFVVAKGGAVNELILWMHGGKFQGAEVVEFLLAACIVGSVLGLAGAAFMSGLDHFHHRPVPSR